MSRRLLPLLFAVTPLSLHAGDEPTELDRYIEKPDPAYSYELVGTEKVEGVTAYFIRMTSQSWLNEDEVNRTTWWHWLHVYVPENVTSETALLFITGGNNLSTDHGKPEGNLVQTAKATGSVTAAISMVPNQPLQFHGDGELRVEDNLISYGWKQFLQNGREEWLAHIPMTKSAVRAMDTITEFLAVPEQGAKKIESFVVSGASKRGWTTWLTSAVDERVVAICPIVIDMLNVVPSFKHHYSAYGFYAPAVKDYVQKGIMEWQDTPEYEKLRSIIEPYEYRERFTMPKLLLNATGDQFFLPDSHRFYFDDLPGPKYMRYVPNTNHSLKGSDAASTIAAWHHITINQLALPDFRWEIDWQKGSIEVNAHDRPAKLLLWQATNPTARDFRLETIGEAWTSSELQLDEEGHLIATVKKPKTGWTAFLVEATYPLENFPAPLKITTGVAVIPDVLPHAE